MTRRSIPLIVFMLLVFAAVPLSAQSIRGRVVNERSRQAVRDAAVSLLNAAGGVVAEAGTDDNGFFTMKAPSGGTYTLVVVQAGFAQHRAEVTVKATGETLIPAVVLEADVYELDPIEAEARARRTEGAAPAAGFQRSSHIVAGDRLATLERQGGTLMTAVKEMSSLRTREFMDPNGVSSTCVESIRSAPTGLQVGGTMMGGNPSGGAPCQWIAIVVDGMIVGGDPMRTFREFRYLGDFESVEYLPPAEAGRLYGMGAAATGALVLWSRGRGPHVSDARNR